MLLEFVWIMDVSIEVLFILTILKVEKVARKHKWCKSEINSLEFRCRFPYRINLENLLMYRS
jgi:hypothetical protein